MALKKSDYQSALDAQYACNLGAVARALVRILDKMEPDMQATVAQAEHPIVRMYVEQLMHLSKGLSYSKAYNACFDIAKGRDNDNG